MQNVPSNLRKDSGTGLSALIFGDWSHFPRLLAGA
jgi:hypothetical protein